VAESEKEKDLPGTETGKREGGGKESEPGSWEGGGVDFAKREGAGGRTGVGAGSPSRGITIQQSEGGLQKNHSNGTNIKDAVTWVLGPEGPESSRGWV